MEPADHLPVLERLQELEGWAQYLTEALHLDQKSEPVKQEMLQRTLGEQTLRQIRELSWSLRDKLHLVTTQLELSRPAGRSMAGAAPGEGRGSAF
ncbi:MAG TPA: hypothetical protein VMU54_00475 [Planctomycetota bacterium]|nr:hypothetical protein [Planctomycetota bacterium]